MKTEPNEPSVVSGEEMQAAARQLPDGGGVFAEAPLRQRLRVVADLLARVGRLPDGPVLVVVPPGGEPLVHPLEGGSLTIGRGAECGVALTGDEKLSRAHFEILTEDGGFLLRDLNSRNGTFLAGNGQRLLTHVLRDGDLILAGDCQFLFCRGGEVG